MSHRPGSGAKPNITWHGDHMPKLIRKGEGKPLRDAMDRAGLTIEDLCGTSRSRVLVTARQIAMYLCRELTDLSLPKIGAQFGNRDHTTVMYADRKINQLLAERRAVFNQVSELTNRVKLQARQG